MVQRETYTNEIHYLARSSAKIFRQHHGRVNKKKISPQRERAAFEQDHSYLYLYVTLYRSWRKEKVEESWFIPFLNFILFSNTGGGGLIPASFLFWYDVLTLLRIGSVIWIWGPAPSVVGTTIKMMRTKGVVKGTTRMGFDFWSIRIKKR